MKTAISLPDEIFEEAERLAQELGTSRSQLYSRAVREFVYRNSPDRVTEAMNRALDAAGGADSDLESFRRRAARAVIERTEW